MLMINYNENSLEAIKNNLEIIKLLKFIDDSELNEKFKSDIKTVLFSIDEDDYKLNDNILKSSLQLNNLISIIKKTVSHFNINSNDVNNFEKELYNNIATFYKYVTLPILSVSNSSNKVDKIRYDDGIYYLHDYVPDTTPKDFLYKFSRKKQETSHEIWSEYKKNDDGAIKRFTKEFMCAISWLSNNVIGENIDRICLVSVPSSTHERDVDSPIRKSIGIIESWHNCGKADYEFGCSKEIIDAGFLLYRFEDLELSHRQRGSKRSKYRDHMRTIRVRDEKQLLSLDNTFFIIMDDIATKRNTIRACNKKLVENGVNEGNILKLVIGKTVWWSR